MEIIEIQTERAHFRQVVSLTLHGLDQTSGIFRISWSGPDRASSFFFCGKPTNAEAHGDLQKAIEERSYSMCNLVSIEVHGQSFEARELRTSSGVGKNAFEFFGCGIVTIVLWTAWAALKRHWHLFSGSLPQPWLQLYLQNELDQRSPIQIYKVRTWEPGSEIYAVPLPEHEMLSTIYHAESKQDASKLLIAIALFIKLENCRWLVRNRVLCLFANFYGSSHPVTYFSPHENWSTNNQRNWIFLCHQWQVMSSLPVLSVFVECLGATFHSLWVLRRGPANVFSTSKVADDLDV